MEEHSSQDKGYTVPLAPSLSKTENGSRNVDLFRSRSST